MLHFFRWGKCGVIPSTSYSMSPTIIEVHFRIYGDSFVSNIYNSIMYMNDLAGWLFQVARRDQLSDEEYNMILRGINNPILLRHLGSIDEYPTTNSYDIDAMRRAFDEFIDSCSDEEIERIYSMDCWAR